jgi:hypothetical protein
MNDQKDDSYRQIEERLGQLRDVRDAAKVVVQQAEEQIEMLTSLRDMLMEFEAAMTAQEIERAPFEEGLN